MLKLLDRVSLFLNEEVIWWELGVSTIQTNEAEKWVNIIHSDKTNEDKVFHLWQSVDDQAWQFKKLLAMRIDDIRLIYLSQTHEIAMTYIFESLRRGMEYTSCWVAHSPATNEQIKSMEGQLSTSLPTNYVSFAKIHNGFLLNGNGAEGIRSIDNTFLVNVAHLEDKHSCADKQLLAVCGDGVGNEYCMAPFDVTKSNEECIYKWDHESETIDDCVPFWNFMFDYLTANM